MRKILLISSATLLVLLFLSQYNTNKIHDEDNYGNGAENPKIEDETLSYKPHEIENSQYVFNIIRVSDFDNIVLHSNLEEKLNSNEIMKAKDCKQLISAGFFNEENDHIGLFISEYKPLSGSINSQTFHAYFFIKNNLSDISMLVPNSPRLAVQSGPLLMTKGETLIIRTKSDEGARRIIVAKTYTNELLFLVIYKKDSLFQGPNLNELPEILEKLQDQQGIEIKDALNLDGGAHSTFYSDEVKIDELSPIGGYFCIK